MMDKTVPKIEGGCLCGAVRYSCEAEPAMKRVCHCAHRKKQSGTSFSVIVAVPRESLEVMGMVFRSYRDTGESGQAVCRRFCGECGSPIVSDVEAVPGLLLFVKSGTLDDTTRLKPATHIWMDHRQPWVSIPDGATTAGRNPPND